MKKAVCVLLVLAVVLSGGISAFATGADIRNIPESVRIIDGLLEMIRNGVFRLCLRNNFPDCAHLYNIPELDSGYVPQGFCFIDEMNLFAISAYHEENSSIVIIVDAGTGERLKTVSLRYEDGGECSSHAGGLADIGEYLFVSSGKSLRRIRISDILEADDYSYVTFCGVVRTDMQASYACSYGNYLLVGQYYSFTFGNTYETPAEQRIYMPTGEKGYAMCEVLDLTDMESVIENEGTTPVLLISMPNSVQGIAYDGKSLVTSTTSTALGKSALTWYTLDSFEGENTFTMRGGEIPLVFMTKDRITRSTDLPPMAEGIDRFGEELAGIFESGASKFNALIRTPYICEYK